MGDNMQGLPIPQTQDPMAGLKPKMGRMAPSPMQGPMPQPAGGMPQMGQPQQPDPAMLQRLALLQQMKG